MQIQHDVFIHFPHDKLEELAALLRTEFAANRSKLTNLKEIIMATSAEHAQALRDMTAQNEKSRVEQLAALKKLQDALDAAGGTTAEVDAAMVQLKASIQADDDSNPDAATAPA